MNRRVLLFIALALVALLLLGGGVVALRALSKSELARKQLLLPEVRAALDQLREALASRGVETFVGSTRRTEDEQAAKVAAGLSDTTQSWHTLGRALELYAVVDGQPDTSAKREDLVRLIHEVAPQFGFAGIAYKNPTAGDFTKKHLKSGAWDANHLQFTEGMTFAQAAAAAKRTA